MANLERRRGLRLVVYDTSSNTTKVAGSKLPVGISSSWVLGSRLYRSLRWVDHCKGFDRWDSMIYWLATFRKGMPIDQIQFWGHGLPGEVYVNHEKITATDIDRSSALKYVADRMSPESTFWVRTCATFSGRKGHHFASVLAAKMGCKAVGYTHLIGLIQSGMRGIYPLQEPYWPTNEGGKDTMSRLTAPNTSTCLRSDPLRSAFKRVTS